MKLNDDKIKDLLHRYFEKYDSKLINEIKSEVGEYIYFFPKVSFKKDYDICGEFYLFVIERIEDILKNFPLDSGIRFQTWFNYVLKNQYLNFLRFNRKEAYVELSIDDYEDEIPLEAFESEELSFKEIENVFSSIERMDGLILKLFYIPDVLTAEEIGEISRKFGVNISTVIKIHREIICKRQMEFQHIRKLSEKIKELNSKIMELKYKLYKGNLSLDEKQKILFKIARLEGERFKHMRRLFIYDKDVMLVLANLFGSREKATYRLKIAKQKFKFYFLKSHLKVGFVS